MIELAAAAAIGVVIAAFIGKIGLLPLHIVTKLVTNSIAGAVMLWVVKIFATKVEINLLSALVAGLLGLPGVIVVLVYTYFLK